MTERTQWESIKGEGGQLVDRVKELVHKGNVRRIVIKQGERTIAEFPLTFGVIGVVLAPVLAAIGAITAMVSDCTIHLERTEETTPGDVVTVPVDSDEAIDDL